MRPVVLSGFMATGKSTAGRFAARLLDVPFLDTDELIAEEAGASVGDVFAKEGEARFRDREAELVGRLLEDPSPRVIAFGGGTVTLRAARHRTLEVATLVTLTAGPESVVARVPSFAERPNLGARSPLARVRDLLDLRREAYGECHARIDTEGMSVEDVAERIASIARRDLLAVPLGTRSYAVELADGEPGRLAETISELAPSGILVVTDTCVTAARGEWLASALAGASARIHSIELPPGEEHKTLASVSRIWDEALAGGFDRRALFLAFGGGVVGDLTGFCASTFLRGVRCMCIPTTLLSMVDASVGGKTGFDHARGKNLLGTFAQPTGVLVDLDHLTTLSRRERSAGYAEVVKIALACDAHLLRMLEGGAALRDVVRASIGAKIRVVRDDEREGGIRALLNLGHTVGHALEAFGGFQRWLHGEAVAIGTVVEIEACERLGLTPAGTAKRAKELLAAFGLPTEVSREELAAAWPFTRADKKRSGDEVSLPVVTGEGTARVEKISLETLRRTMTG